MSPGEEKAAPQASVSWVPKALEAGKVRQLQVYQFRRLRSEKDKATHISQRSAPDSSVGCFNLILGKHETYKQCNPQWAVHKGDMAIAEDRGLAATIAFHMHFTDLNYRNDDDTCSRLLEC